MRSIERYLLSWIVAALLLGSVLVAVAIYAVLLNRLNESFDDNLHNIASAVAGYHRSGRSMPEFAGAATAPVLDPDDDADIVTVTWTLAGNRIYTSDGRVDVPFSAAPGRSRPVIDGAEWVMYTSVVPDGVVQAAQRLSARHLLAIDAATQLVTPLLGLVLVAGCLLIYGLRRGLRPLDDAAGDIKARTAKTLEPIPTHDVPLEIVPLVSAINGLMYRLSSAFALQRRFLADAAHELRTPITALRLQLSLLRNSDNAAERLDATNQLAAGIARSQHLIEQLLQVARAEPDAGAVAPGRVELGELVQSVVATFSAKAEALDLDLGAVVRGAAVVEGDREQLLVLLNNLVDNALRYSAPGGVVDVEVGMPDGRPTLAVVDDGPGIAMAERERVFDRFYRGAAAARGREGGSGLGLSIVSAIAERHGAEVELRTPAAGRGLEARVVFPGIEAARRGELQYRQPTHATP